MGGGCVSERGVGRVERRGIPMNLTWPSLSQTSPPSLSGTRWPARPPAIFHTYSARVAGPGVTGPTGPTRPRDGGTGGTGGIDSRAAMCCLTAHSRRPSRRSKSELQHASQLAQPGGHRDEHIPGVDTPAERAGGRVVDTPHAQIETGPATRDAAVALDLRTGGWVSEGRAAEMARAELARRRRHSAQARKRVYSNSGSIAERAGEWWGGREEGGRAGGRVEGGRCARSRLQRGL